MRSQEMKVHESAVQRRSQKRAMGEWYLYWWSKTISIKMATSMVWRIHTQESLFWLTWQPGDLSRSTTTVRMDSHWRKDNWLSNLPPTQPYREVTAVPVVRSTYRELRQRTGHQKSRMDQFSTWGSRFQAQSPKIAFKGKSVEDQPEKSEKTDS